MRVASHRGTRATLRVNSTLYIRSLPSVWNRS